MTARHLDDGLFDRGIRALTPVGQRQLRDTHVAVVGLGSLGAIHAKWLARYGCGQLTLIDDDELERSNLPRVPGTTPSDVGRPKVTVLNEYLAAATPWVDVTAIQSRAEEAVDHLRECDVILAGVDQISARMWLNYFAVHTGVPYIDAGMLIRVSDKESTDTATPQRHVDSVKGYIQRIVPGNTACFSCLGRADREQARIERLDPVERAAELDRGYIDTEDIDDQPAPAVIGVNGIVASLAVQTLINHVTEITPPQDYTWYDGVTRELTARTTTPRADCSVCGDTGGDDLDLDLHLDLSPDTGTEADAVDVDEAATPWPPSPISGDAQSDAKSQALKDRDHTP